MTKSITYRPKGVCSVQYDITVTDGVIDEIAVQGGCNGNLKGLSALLKGMEAKAAIARLEGITCGFKTTSCPDQIAKALKEAIGQDA